MSPFSEPSLNRGFFDALRRLSSEDLQAAWRWIFCLHACAKASVVDPVKVPVGLRKRS